MSRVSPLPKSFAARLLQGLAQRWSPLAKNRVLDARDGVLSEAMTSLTGKHPSVGGWATPAVLSPGAIPADEEVVECEISGANLLGTTTRGEVTVGGFKFTSSVPGRAPVLIEILKNEETLAVTLSDEDGIPKVTVEHTDSTLTQIAAAWDASDAPALASIEVTGTGSDEGGAISEFTLAGTAQCQDSPGFEIDAALYVAGIRVSHSENHAHAGVTNWTDDTIEFYFDLREFPLEAFDAAAVQLFVDGVRYDLGNMLIIDGGEG